MHNTIEHKNLYQNSWWMCQLGWLRASTGITSMHETGKQYYLWYKRMPSLGEEIIWIFGSLVVGTILYLRQL